MTTGMFTASAIAVMKARVLAQHEKLANSRSAILSRQRTRNANLRAWGAGAEAGNRAVVTADGIIHDMVADGTYEHGVNDVMAVDFTTPIEVAASYEDGVLVLRPRGLDGFEVRRWREGEEVVWRYHTLFTTRSVRVDR